MSKWVETDARWYDQQTVHCGCCGRLIARHFLHADVDGERKIFCSEGCERLYRAYVLVERGHDYRPPVNVWDLYEVRTVK